MSPAWLSWEAAGLLLCSACGGALRGRRLRYCSARCGSTARGRRLRERDRRRPLTAREATLLDNLP